MKKGEGGGGKLAHSVTQYCGTLLYATNLIGSFQVSDQNLQLCSSATKDINRSISLFLSLSL